MLIRCTVKGISYADTYIHFLKRFLSHTGHYRVLGRVSCAVGSAGKEFVYIAEGHLNCRRPEFNPWVRWGRSPGKGSGNPLQYSCLEDSIKEEPGGLQSVGSQRVRYDSVTQPPPCAVSSSLLVIDVKYSCMYMSIPVSQLASPTPPWSAELFHVSEC